MSDITADEFSKIASQLRDLVNQQLEHFSEFGDGCPERLQQAIQHSLMAPGKRLRPLMVLFAAEACGSHQERAMPAACAIEMVHAYSLIHDDLPAMDDDDLRRGRPTCHKAFDEATAILAGDALLTRAFEVLAVHQQPLDAANRCCVELAHAAGATQMVGGQADDLGAETLENANLDHLISIHRRKTGAMLTASLRMGAIIANATHEQIEGLTAYGSKLGLAFQIVDDLLDLVGEEEKLGKRTGQDSDRGKLTFPALLGIEASQQRAENLIQEAIADLSPLRLHASCLEALANFVVQRNH
ncbi:MAG: polyprenyl synthetase family protein [Planctomycetaceae bacterium]|nr:polyprenyl synthetase family protein [Planctomycetaceae bacterium]